MANLINALLEKKLITPEQLQDAQNKQVGAKKPLQDLLVEMAFVQEKDVTEMTSKIFQMPICELKDENINPSGIKWIPYNLTKKYGVFPVRKERDILILAMSNPGNVIALDDINAIIDMPIKPLLASGSDIHKHIDEYYQSDDMVYGLLNNNVQEEEINIVDKEDAETLIQDMGSREYEQIDTSEKAMPELPPEFKSLLEEDCPTVKLVNMIIGDAIKERASDIHLEPREHFVEIRNRIDGDLKYIMKIPIKFHRRIVARIKILSNLDITEQIKPQDGRIHLSIKKNKVDLRVSSTSTFYGEKVVIRILNANEAKTDLDQIGLEPSEKEPFVAAITSPQGMIFVTGPTGSGKTSTLYAALNYIKGEKINIITVEDPIEYVNEGINQIQVNPARGVTFASGLRSILRQDPDVVLIGEIRDQETAEIAVKASLTGHLVLATLHTNSCVATISRLADIGVDYYQIASAVILIANQRLIKVLCSHCKEEYTPDENFKNKFKPQIETHHIHKFYRAQGCPVCNFTGYFGRTAVFEILKINDKLKNLIANQATEEDISKEAQKGGLKLLFESGLSKVAQGLTTLDEVVAQLGAVKQEATQSEVNEPVCASLPDGSEESLEVGSPQKILIVDDEEDIRKIVCKYLETDGYDVLKAKNGLEAIECAIREKPNLIIMDIMMPVMDGFEATKKLRSRLETAVIPIMMLTAKKDKASELEGIDAGADDYITKPFDKDKFLARIKMLLRRRI